MKDIHFTNDFIGNVSCQHTVILIGIVCKARSIGPGVSVGMHLLAKGTESKASEPTGQPLPPPTFKEPGIKQKETTKKNTTTFNSYIPTHVKQLSTDHLNP